MAVPPTTIVGLGGHFKGQAATFSGTRVSIGRNRTHALCFTGDLSLSRDHAVLTYDGETWNIRDLGSRNGTWVNGKQLLNTYPHPLRPGDSFRCGAQNFEIAWDAVPGPVLLGAPVEPPPVQRIPPPPPSLVRASARPNHWVKKGEAVEIHGWHITAGLFFFGTGLRDLAGWGMEPALVDPELDVASEGPLRESTLPYSPTYRTLGPVGRSQYL
ncbi:FHA domain-containing protein, partial [bacterium]